jgi:predicted DNA-binding protein (MmcQ/YjbR family)
VFAEDPHLARLTEICLGLPEATRELSDRHAGFRVRGKTFAWFLDDHHRDGIVGVVCKVPAGQAESLVACDPERFYRAAYLGARGWVGRRLDIADVDWPEVEGLVVGSYRLIAPRRLAAQLDD